MNANLKNQPTTLTTPGAPSEYQEWVKLAYARPTPDRGVGVNAPAETMNLSGIGVDSTGKQGTAPKIALDPRLAADVQRSQTRANALAPGAIQDAVRAAGIVQGEVRKPPPPGLDRDPMYLANIAGYSGEPPRMNARDNNIVVFYTNLKSNKVHVLIQAAGDKLQAIDRPARESDRDRYPRQWLNYINSQKPAQGGVGAPLDPESPTEVLINHGAREGSDGTPIEQLFSQQPGLVKALQGLNIYTVENLVNLSDLGIEAIAHLGGVELVQRGKVFLSTRPIAERDDKIIALVGEVEALKSENETLRRPRPRK